MNELFAKNLLSANQVLHEYNLGYAAVLDHQTVEHLRHMPGVDMIEANQKMYTTEVQRNPKNWGLDRISQRQLPLTGQYPYPDHAGEGVDVYVIDTGVNILHEDFEGRAIWGVTTPQGDQDKDGHGHGTHVASTIAGKLYGVAKKANIIAVKVLRSDGSGTTADVLKGVEWAATEHIRKVRASEGRRTVKSVANMSLGGGKSNILDMAVDKSIQKGVLFAVAAGNDNRNACNFSPAATESALTVGATDRHDRRSSFSNYGECVDVFGPGSDITAAWINTLTGTRTISGTSMASPHVCGVMALMLAEEELTPAELKAKVLKFTTEHVVKNPGIKSPNRLLFSPNPEVTEVATEKVPSLLDGVGQSIVNMLRFQQ